MNDRGEGGRSRLAMVNSLRIIKTTGGIHKDINISFTQTFRETLWQIQRQEICVKVNRRSLGKTLSQENHAGFNQYLPVFEK